MITFEFQSICITPSPIWPVTKGLELRNGKINIRRNICESQNGGIQSPRKGRASDVGIVLRMGLESTSGFEGSLAASLSEIGVLEF